MKTYKANKIHIGIFGKRNSGKSTLANILLNQDFSIVSEVPGTTTDVHEKSLELEGLGAVVLLDTAGIDDVNELGLKRVDRTFKALDRVDVAIYVTDGVSLDNSEEVFLDKLKKRNLPTLIVANKNDIQTISKEILDKIKTYFSNIISVSAKNDKDIPDRIRKKLLEILPKEIVNPKDLMGDLVEKNERVVLVIPLDKEAPKDRIILPQVQVLRNLLDKKCITTVCSPQNLSEVIKKDNPNLVITDSQAFKEVSEIVPLNIPITSFSILFARLKGDLKTFIDGAKKLDNIQNGDKVLICESCSHHPVEDDIGKVKIPNLVKKYTKKEIVFENYMGCDFPDDIEKYALIIHCGGCMTTRREILNRIFLSKDRNVAITNYGIAISKCLGILERASEIFFKL